MFVLTADLPDEHEKRYWSGVRWRVGAKTANRYHSHQFAKNVAKAVEHRLMIEYDFPVDVNVEELDE